MSDVIERKTQLRDAKKAAREAEAKKRLDEYVAKVVAEAPPLTPAQIDRVWTLLHPTSPLHPSRAHVPERPEVKALREAEAALIAAKRAFADALGGCQGCGLSAKVHGYQKNYGTGFHDFVALTSADVIGVAKVHGRLIAAAERALEKAKA